jgi:hypothetical protein
MVDVQGQDAVERPEVTYIQPFPILAGTLRSRGHGRLNKIYNDLLVLVFVPPTSSRTVFRCRDNHFERIPLTST